MSDKIPEYFMKEAAKTLSQRGMDNGYDAGQERSAAAVADMFNSMYPGFDLTEEHIWSIMLSVKLVRNARKPREDNIVDLIGYAGLLGESQSATKKAKPSLHEKRGPSMDARKVDVWHAICRKSGQEIPLRGQPSAEGRFWVCRTDEGEQKFDIGYYRVTNRKDMPC